MKLETLQDIEKLPSVLDVEEVSLRLVELVEVIHRQNVSPLEGAEEINDLISNSYPTGTLTLQGTPDFLGAP